MGCEREASEKIEREKKKINKYGLSDIYTGFIQKKNKKEKWDFKKKKNFV